MVNWGLFASPLFCSFCLANWRPQDTHIKRRKSHDSTDQTRNRNKRLRVTTKPGKGARNDCHNDGANKSNLYSRFASFNLHLNMFVAFRTLKFHEIPGNAKNTTYHIFVSMRTCQLSSAIARCQTQFLSASWAFGNITGLVCNCSDVGLW